MESVSFATILNFPFKDFMFCVFKNVGFILFFGKDAQFEKETNNIRKDILKNMIFRYFILIISNAIQRSGYD
ncbi:hypothetical protein D7035_21855 [Aquimarina sp. AD1]|nr:hypothetical protein D7035_21855 [Aquimarina sp. AD1]